MSMCKYCDSGIAIENSHVISKFIFKWLKISSATGALRDTVDPNIRRQDGPKVELLCKSCEQKFGIYENDFKKNVFSKIANYRNSCPKEILLTSLSKKCIYSIAWRVLADFYYFSKDNDFTENELAGLPIFLDKIKGKIECSSKSSEIQAHVIPCTEEILDRLQLPQIDIDLPAFFGPFGT